MKYIKMLLRSAMYAMVIVVVVSITALIYYEIDSYKKSEWREKAELSRCVYALSRIHDAEILYFVKEKEFTSVDVLVGKKLLDKRELENACAEPIVAKIENNGLSFVIENRPKGKFKDKCEIVVSENGLKYRDEEGYCK